MTEEQLAWADHLKLIEHHLDWQHQLDTCNEMQESTKVQIQKAIEALKF